MKQSSLLLILLCLPALSIASGDIYKWEEGNQTEFSQIPPTEPNTEIDVVTPTSAPPSKPSSTPHSKQDNASAQPLDNKIQQKAVQEAQTAEAKTNAYNCGEYKKYLSSLLARERIKLIDTQGNAKILTPEERDQEIKTTEKKIAESCGENKSGATPSGEIKK